MGYARGRSTGLSFDVQLEKLNQKSERGAHSSCILYSLVETAKANGLIPADYLTYCFDRLAIAPDDLDTLLP